MRGADKQFSIHPPKEGNGDPKKETNIPPKLELAKPTQQEPLDEHGEAMEAYLSDGEKNPADNIIVFPSKEVKPIETTAEVEEGMDYPTQSGGRMLTPEEGAAYEEEILRKRQEKLTAQQNAELVAPTQGETIPTNQETTTASAELDEHGQAMEAYITGKEEDLPKAKRAKVIRFRKKNNLATPTQVVDMSSEVITPDEYSAVPVETTPHQEVEPINAEQQENFFNTVTGLREIDHLSDQDLLNYPPEKLRTHLDEAFAKLKQEEEKFSRIKKDHGTFKRLASRFKLTSDGGAAYDEAKRQKEMVKSQQALYMNALNSYINRHKLEEVERLKGLGLKNSRRELNARMKDFAVTREVIPVQIETEGEIKEVMVTPMEFVLANQRDLAYSRHEQLDPADQNIFQAWKEKISHTTQRVMREHIHLFTDGEKMEQKLAGAMGTKDLRKLNRKLKNYTNKVEGQQTMYEQPFRELKPGESMLQLISQAVNYDNEKVQAVFREFVSRTVPEVKKQFKINDQEAMHYVRWRVGQIANPSRRTPFRLLEKGNGMQLMIPNFSREYLDPQYQKVKARDFGYNNPLTAAA